MNQNSKPPDTYDNRVAQFKKAELEREKKNTRIADILKASPKVAKALDPNNPYLQARKKVLKSYGPERLKIINECEQLNKLDVKEYDRFIYDILMEAGDVPTHGLRKRTEECGCYSCRGRKNK